MHTVPCACAASHQQQPQCALVQSAHALRQVRGPEVRLQELEQRHQQTLEQSPALRKCSHKCIHKLMDCIPHELCVQAGPQGLEQRHQQPFEQRPGLCRCITAYVCARVRVCVRASTRVHVRVPLTHHQHCALVLTWACGLSSRRGMNERCATASSQQNAKPGTDSGCRECSASATTRR